MVNFYAGKGVKDDQEALALVVGKIHEGREEIEKSQARGIILHLAPVRRGETQRFWSYEFFS